MRVHKLPFALAFFTMLGCSRAPKLPVPDFAPYQHLAPGTRIKVVPIIETGGSAADLPAVRNAMLQTEASMAVTGRVKEITKTRLSIRSDNSKDVGSFTPEQVRSIEVLPPLVGDGVGQPAE